MSYHRQRRQSTLVSRARHGGALGDFTDTLKDIFKGGISIYSQGQQAKGAAAATAQSNKDLAAALAAQRGGISTETILIGGAAIAAVALIVTRKKAS